MAHSSDPNAVTIRHFVRSLDASGQIARQIVLSSDTMPDMVSKNPRQMIRKGESDEAFAQRKALGQEAHKLYPKGIGKIAVSRVLVGYEYESSVNAQRIAEGKEPTFEQGPLWKGGGEADPELPAYMVRNKKSGHGYLRTRALTDEHGNVVKDYEQLYDKASGRMLTPEEQARAKTKFLQPEGKATKQGLEQDVRPRAFREDHITGASLPGAEETTPIKAPSAAEAEAPPQKSPVAAQPGDEVPQAAAGDDPQMAAMLAKAVWQKTQSQEDAGGGEDSQPAPNPKDSDNAVSRQNAAHAYRQLGSVIGGVFGSLGGPAAGALGSALGGLFGHAAGGGDITGTDVAKAGLGAAAGAMGGKAGMVSNALGNFIGAMSGGGQQASAGGGGGGTSSGGGGGDENDMAYMIRHIYRWTKLAEAEGVYVRSRRGGSGSTI